MKWTAIIDGQPPSLNHSYRPIMKKSAYGNRHLSMAKEVTVVAYQEAATWLFIRDRPKDWKHAGGWLRVEYEFHLLRWVDCDNAMKALNDALQVAIGVDDRWFLPCVKAKSVNSKEPRPRVEVTIVDLSESPSLPAPSSTLSDTPAPSTSD